MSASSQRAHSKNGGVRVLGASAHLEVVRSPFHDNVPRPPSRVSQRSRPQPRAPVVPSLLQSPNRMLDNLRSCWRVPIFVVCGMVRGPGEFNLLRRLRRCEHRRSLGDTVARFWGRIVRCQTCQTSLEGDAIRRIPREMERGQVLREPLELGEDWCQLECTMAVQLRR